MRFLIHHWSTLAEHQVAGDTTRRSVVVLLACWKAASLACCLAAALACTIVRAQPPQVHHFDWGDQPPGMIGKAQLKRGRPLQGYFQPVEIKVPPGAAVSVASARSFSPPRDHAMIAGMLIGEVYRLKVTGIPNHPGHEVFPTIEVIDRLYPPADQLVRFPIPVQFSQQEFDLALSGKYLVRVIYVEDPENALPRPEDPAAQRYFEVRPEADVLRVADDLGRPVAIMRMGGRVPGSEGLNDEFLFGAPPWVSYEHMPDAPPPAPHGEVELQRDSVRRDTLRLRPTAAVPGIGESIR